MILCSFQLFTFLSSRILSRGGIDINKKHYRFYYGTVIKLVGKQEKDLDKCIPKEWIGTNPTKDDQKAMIESLIAVQAVLSKVSVLLTKKVENACKDKKYLASYLKKRIHFVPRSSATQKKRLFMQITRKMENKEYYTRSKIRPFNAISIYFKDFKNAVTGFFDLPTVDASLKIFPCLPGSYPNVKGIKDTSQEIISRVEKLKKNDDSTIDVLVDGLCNWHRLRRSIAFLNSSFKQSNGLTRFQGFGYYYARLLSALANTEAVNR